MKTVLIILLGFAGVLPATCSKDKAGKQSENKQPVKIDTGVYRSDIALYGPAIIVVKNPQRNA